MATSTKSAKIKYTKDVSGLILALIGVAMIGLVEIGCLTKTIEIIGIVLCICGAGVLVAPE